MSRDCTLNSDSQPQNIAINYKRNKAKAILTLKGIIDGIHCDEELNSIEEMYLRAWKDNDMFQFNDGDFIDVHEQIEDILEDSIITSEEKIDLQQMLDDILKYDAIHEEGYNALANQLLGFLSGISADDNLNDKEIFHLNDLLNRSPLLCGQWPGIALKKRLDEVLLDSVIDEKERKDLLNLIKSVSGQKLSETGLAYGMSAEFSTTDKIELVLSGLTICFTGQFLSGSRKFQSDKASKLGASVKNNITRQVDLLVLGSVASRDWKFSSYGGKIENVLSNRLKGASTEIINEEVWNQITSGI